MIIWPFIFGISLLALHLIFSVLLFPFRPLAVLPFTHFLFFLQPYVVVFWWKSSTCGHSSAGWDHYIYENIITEHNISGENALNHETGCYITKSKVLLNFLLSSELLQRAETFDKFAGLISSLTSGSSGPPAMSNGYKERDYSAWVAWRKGRVYTCRVDSLASLHGLCTLSLSSRQPRQSNLSLYTH